MSLVKELLKTYYELDDSSKIDIDNAINFLLESGQFTLEEYASIKMVKEQENRAEIAKLLGISTRTLKRRVNDGCDKIANALGERYQDSKILLQVEERLGRELTTDEEKFCLHVIKTGVSPKGSNIFCFKIVNGKVVNDEHNGNKEKG